MSTLYKRIYTYTGQSNAKGSGSVALSKFAVSGDTAHAINQIVSVKLEHYHTSTSRPTWALTGQLVLSTGAVIASDAVSHKFNSDIYKYTNSWSNLPTAAQFAQIATVKVASQATSGSGDLYWRATKAEPMRLTVEFYDTPPVVYAPKVAKFEAWRVDSSGARADDGTTIRATIRLGLALASNAGLSSLRLYYSTGAVSTASSSLSFSASQIRGMLSADYTLTLSGSYASGSDWNLLLRYNCGEEESVASVTVPRAFATLHLSPCSTGGAAFGGFSSATEGNPKFEVHHPAYLYGGIAQVGSGSALPALGLQSGLTERQTIPGSGVTQVSVAFEKAYAAAPVVVAGLVSTSASYYMGRCSCAADNITATGFDLHFYNGGSDDRGVYGAWCAIGTPA